MQVAQVSAVYEVSNPDFPAGTKVKVLELIGEVAGVPVYEVEEVEGELIGEVYSLGLHELIAR